MKVGLRLGGLFCGQYCGCRRGRRSWLVWSTGAGATESTATRSTWKRRTAGGSVLMNGDPFP